MARTSSPAANKGKKKTKNIDPFVNSRLVEGLKFANFQDFIVEKDAALVMFYDPKDPQCEWSKKHFLKAAKMTDRENHAYCAVDCSNEGELCGNENVMHVPYFKLYSKGKTVGTYGNPRAFLYHEMRRYVENAPVLTEPTRPKRPCDIGKE